MASAIIQFLKSVLNKTITSIDTTAHGIYLSGMTFSGCTHLTTVSMPNCTEASHFTFSGCTGLTTCYMPNTYRIDGNMFNNCRALTSITLTRLNITAQSAFANCYALQSMDFPWATSLYVSTAFNCSNLRVVNLPRVTDAMSYAAFVACSQLQELYLDSIEQIGKPGYPSRICNVVPSTMSKIYLPNCTHIYGGFEGVACDFSVFQAPNLRVFSGLSLAQSCSMMVSIVHSRIEQFSMYIPNSISCLSIIDLPACVTFTITGGAGSRPLDHPLSVNLPNASFVSGYFNRATSFNAPNATAIYGTFFNNSELTYLNIDFTKLTRIDANFMENCTYLSNISEVVCPVCSYIGNNLFAMSGSGNTTLTTISFATLSSVANNAFERCPALSSVYMPNVTYISGYAFALYSGTSVLNRFDLDLPILPNVPGYAFISARHLQTLKLSICSRIAQSAFWSCGLTTLYLYSTSIVQLAASAYAVFGRSPVYSQGSVYVPASLVDVYKVDVSWAGMSSRIVAIPE